METVTNAIQITKLALNQAAAPDPATNYLEVLATMQNRLLENVELLFSSLNVGVDFPELRGFPLPFVQTLLLARDLKRNIRMRAIEAFFEWDRLDQAVGGREEALGWFRS